MKVLLDKIKPNGNIMVPVELLKKTGLKPGSEVIIHLENGTLTIEKPRSSISHLRGKFKNINIEKSIHNLRERWKNWNRRISV